ncbi:MAG: M56 family metallopeptidase [Vicinamibacteria bacterium]|nr:M56 family metallopeptidase [Vicinamibacteria bacterium]
MMTALQLALGWTFGIAFLVLWAEVTFLLVSKHTPGLRARFWNVTLLLALALPAFFVLPGPRATDTNPATIRLLVVMAQESVASIQRAPVTLVNGVFLAWAIVASVFLARVARSGRQLAILTRSARLVATEPDVAFPVLESEEVTTPSASFIGRAILVPPAFRSMPDYWRRAILAHESIHLERRHGLAIVAEEVLRAFFWFHPLMWRLITRVRHSREEAVDAETVATVGDHAAYRELLISLATRSHPLAPAVSGADSLCARLRSLATLEKRTMPNLAAVRVLCASLSMLGVTVSASAHHVLRRAHVTFRR